MSAMQKIAWCNLFILAATAALFLVALQRVGLLHAQAVLALFALTPLTIHFARDRKGPDGRYCWDEREKLVWTRAQLGGWCASWFYLILACMGTWAVLLYVEHQDVVTVNALPLIVWGAWATFTVGQSVTILMNLGWTSQDA